MSQFSRGLIKNSTTLVQRQAAHTALGLGIFLTFNMGTFHNQEQADYSWGNSTFAPSALDMDQWFTGCILPAKAKYAVFVASHSDGFCLWNTATTSHNVMNSPVATDLVDVFYAKCIQYNILPVVYNCIWDNTYENAVSGGSKSNKAGYRAYKEAQLAEVLNKGSAMAQWLDGTAWRFNDISNGYPGDAGNYYPWDSAAQRNGYIKNISPKTLIVDNSQIHDLSGTDVIEFEDGTVGAQCPSNNTSPAEQCDTIYSVSNLWFDNNSSNKTTFTSTELKTTYDTLQSRHCNFLMNCPPDRSGTIPSSVCSVMSAFGAMI